MRFKDVFSIIGPAMVGPSSSHTAGAARIGRVARKLFGALPEEAKFVFFGSFAETYQGHGTDLAIVGGLLDFNTDDLRIPNSIELAKQQNMKISFERGTGLIVHPNTVEITLLGNGEKVSLIGASIGGGNIEILKVNDFNIKFTGQYPTLLIFHEDRPGMLAHITSLMSAHQLNIGYMDVERKARSGNALTVIEADHPIPDSVIDSLRFFPHVQQVKSVDLSEEEEEGT